MFTSGRDEEYFCDSDHACLNRNGYWERVHPEKTVLPIRRLHYQIQPQYGCKFCISSWLQSISIFNTMKSFLVTVTIKLFLAWYIQSSKKFWRPNHIDSITGYLFTSVDHNLACRQANAENIFRWSSSCWNRGNLSVLTHVSYITKYHQFKNVIEMYIGITASYGTILVCYHWNVFGLHRL